MALRQIRRSGSAEWLGGLRSGSGTLSTNSEALKDQEYSFGTRFEAILGTNPEELIAAAHAACYSMAFADMLSDKGYQPKRIQTRAICSLAPLPGGGWSITKMRLETRGEVPGMDQATFVEEAHAADKKCPVSNLLRPGLEIELDAAIL